MKKFNTHILYYVPLGTVLLIGFLTAWQVRWTFILLPIIYSVLTLLHHAHEHTVTPKIVVEYLLIAGIGAAFFTLLLIGGVI